VKTARPQLQGKLRVVQTAFDRVSGKNGGKNSGVPCAKGAKKKGEGGQLVTPDLGLREAPRKKGSEKERGFQNARNEITIDKGNPTEGARRFRPQLPVWPK